MGGADRLFGDEGEDVLEGGAGADELHGGDHNDTASYDMATAASSQSWRSVDFLGKPALAGEAIGDSYSDIENLRGSAFNDTLIGDGDGNKLEGIGGNDVLNGRQGFDTLVGGAGNDIYIIDRTVDLVPTTTSRKSSGSPMPAVSTPYISPPTQTASSTTC